MMLWNSGNSYWAFWLSLRWPVVHRRQSRFSSIAQTKRRACISHSTQTTSGKKLVSCARWVSASSDFRQFNKDEKSQIDQAAWTRDTATTYSLPMHPCGASADRKKVPCATDTTWLPVTWWCMASTSVPGWPTTIDLFPALEHFIPSMEYFFPKVVMPNGVIIIPLCPIYRESQ